MLRSTLVAVVVTASFGYAADADACGGLFCSQQSPTPVDQAAERILFEVLDDGSVSATVEIKYEGNPGEFSWIVPVTGTPDFVEVAGKDELQLLDLATAPQIIPPTVNCSDGDFVGGGGGGFGCLPYAAPAADDGVLLEADGGDEGEGEGGGVNVIEYPSVGPFDEIVVVDGGDADVLMQWLNDHGYRVNEKMRPFIEDYIDEGYSFLATQLRADAEVQDMVPIRFHCPQPNPEIPLRLTAISAEPEMGFLVFVAGRERYAPLNYADLDVAPAEVRFGVNDDFSFGNNYFSLVSRGIDEAGGQGFVTEQALPSTSVRSALDNVFIGSQTEQVSRDHLEAVLSTRAFLTRFYGRMNPEEMTTDPIFSDAGNSAVKDGVIDLSSTVSDVDCGFETAPVCGNKYCGDGDGCGATAEGVEGCVCRGDHVARVINAPLGGIDVVCMPPAIDLHGGEGDPCAGSVCGDGGACVAVNDRPTCKCDDDHVAVFFDGGLRCRPLVGEVLENAQLSWPKPSGIVVAPGPREDDDGGCAANAGGSATLLLWGTVGLALRRRRRR